MEDFVTFEIAKKLKEKGFDCKYPFAMYDEDGDFYPLFTSCDEDEDSKCIFGNRMYYGYDDFIGDKDAVIAPIISQVLKWLRDEKKLHIELWTVGKKPIKWCHTITTLNHVGEKQGWSSGERGDSYEAAAIAGIEYTLDNLI